MIILQLKQTKIKLEVFKSGFQHNKNYMNADKVAIKSKTQPKPDLSSCLLSQYGPILSVMVNAREYRRTLQFSSQDTT